MELPFRLCIHPYSRRMFNKGKLSAKGNVNTLRQKTGWGRQKVKSATRHSSLFCPASSSVLLKPFKGMINNNKTKCPRNITVSRIIWAGAWCLEYPPCQHFCFEPFESCEHVHWCQLESCNHILREPVFVILRPNEPHPNLQLGSVCFCLSKTEPIALS